MSSISSVTSTHPITLNYTNSDELLSCINHSNELKANILASTVVSSSYENDNYRDFIDRVCQQKSRLVDLYNFEMERRQPTSQFISFLDRIDELINEYDNNQSINTTKHIDDEFLFNSDINSLNDTDIDETLDEQVSKRPNSIDIKPKIVYKDYDDHSYSKISRTIKHPKKKSTILELKRYKYEGCCPLTTRTYGLDPVKHGIRHFPCTRVTAPINLYKHLIQYHQLTHSPTMQIVRLLADENEEGDIDLFSSQSTSLVATHPTVYRAQCPLNQYGKFGITAEHKIRLCTQPNQTIGAPITTPKDVCLYDHFVVYHQMKRSCAQRLAEAIVKNKTDPVFRPDEQLLNDTFYVQCPLRNPKSICWKSPISTRHMGQHLTGIHKLDRTTRRQIMTAIRKQPSSNEKSTKNTSF